MAEPQSDMRGSADYKRTLVGALLKRAIDIAMRRARGEQVEASHNEAIDKVAINLTVNSKIHSLRN